MVRKEHYTKSWNMRGRRGWQLDRLSILPRTGTVEEVWVREWPSPVEEPSSTAPVGPHTPPGEPPASPRAEKPTEAPEDLPGQAAGTETGQASGTETGKS